MDKKLKRTLEVFGQRYQEFSYQFYSAALEYGRLTNNTKWGSELEVGDTWFSYSGNVSCGRGCCSGYGSITVPFEFLYDRENAVAELQKQQEIQRQAELNAKRETERKAMEKREREERAQFERLQQKYGQEKQ
jgi:hypothetical protein